MSFAQCKLGTHDLPFNFNYEYEDKRRMVVVETYYADVTQLNPWYDGDTYITFDCKLVDSSLKESLFGIFTENDTVTWADLEGNNYNVLLFEFKSKLEKGLWTISGRMKVIPT